MIKKVGSVYKLMSKTHPGRVLGTHASRKQALKQEVAISISKAKHSGHKIKKD